jgi:hypothetical protein
MVCKTKQPSRLVRRNPLHNHPLLCKGVLHRKSIKSKRCLEKVNLKKEWLPQSIFLLVYFEEATLMMCITRINIKIVAIANGNTMS